MVKCICAVLIILTLSCNNDKVVNTNLRKFNLKHNLGVLEIVPPHTLDTLYTWINKNDTEYGDLAMIRLADKKYSLLKESGFLYSESPDSLYHLTIVQNEHPGCKSKNKKPDYVGFAKLKIELLRAENPKIKPDVKISFLNNREYVLAFRNLAVKDKHSISLSATTFIDEETVSVNYSYYGSDPVGFISAINESIKTLAIQESHNVGN
jgi:hypothetical protein